ncbi:MAG: bifunctional DNA-formamidopyrimidine glycosylase/DNA-(apurinic or apyrimidinic site) lyase [Casimicrobium sp.]
MPELPEVETVRRGLSSAIVGQTVKQVVVRDRRLRWPIPPTFETSLIGQRIDRIDRRSKYLLFRLSRDRATLLAHLGMTGSFVVYDRAHVPDVKPHDHVDIVIANGTLLRYNDPRRFGSMHTYEGIDIAQPLLAHLGPEPLTDAFDANYLYANTRRRPGPIKQAIMDNTLIVGVGNIYANESLFRAGIHPNRAANRISFARYERLVAEIKIVLQEAIVAGGSTLRDYVNATGQPGYFQLNYFVYGREGQSCKQCGGVLKLMRHGGRATVVCTQCQR